MINVKEKYYLNKKSSDVHSKVYRELQKSNDGIENGLADVLNRLRLFRNNADYDSEYGMKFFINVLDENDDDLKRGFESLIHLTNHPKY
jgi:hypothetical protein